MGAHLDYNGGPVMPTAIDRGTFLAIRERSDGRVRLASTLDSTEFDANLSEIRTDRTGRWVDYPVGVLLELIKMARSSGRGGDLTGLDVLFGGNLAIGAGLSSSASICVGTAVAVDIVWGLAFGRMDLIHAALRAEREHVGVRCGIMDPYAVGLAREGHLLWLDCKDGTSEFIPWGVGRLSIAIADSLVRRELAHVAFNERVDQCRVAFESLQEHQTDATCLRDVRLEVFRDHRDTLPPIVAKRAEHVLSEVARTHEARIALLANDPRRFGRQMFLAHESLRNLFDVSVPELDQIVDSATRSEGVLGARLTGAGFGGCAVILLESSAAPSVAERIVHEFAGRFGREPSIEVFGGDAGPREIAGPRGGIGGSSGA
jgi:galactokinase